MYVYGGKDADGHKLSDIWAFDPAKLFWREIELSNPKEAYEGTTEEAPLGRGGHSASLIGHYMVVFGGMYDLTKEMNDMHAFDLKNEKWIKLYEDEQNMSPIKLRLNGMTSRFSMQSKPSSTANKNPLGRSVEGSNTR